MGVGEFEPSLVAKPKTPEVPQRGLPACHTLGRCTCLGSAKQARKGALMEDVDHSHRVLELCWQGM